MEMTRQQKRQVEYLRREIIEHDGHSDDCEYKRFDVKIYDWGKVSVISEVGRKSDEGTMAEVFGRTRRHIFIGKRGGMELVNAARFVEKDGEISRVFAANVKGRRAAWAPTI